MAGTSPAMTMDGSLLAAVGIRPSRWHGLDMPAVGHKHELALGWLFPFCSKAQHPFPQGPQLLIPRIHARGSQ